VAPRKIARARAPVRVDFAGGWTDVPPFSTEVGGFVVNACINRYAYATAMTTEAHNFILESGDYGTFIEAQTIRDMEYDGNLDLLKAAVRRLDFADGVRLITRSEAPPGSGTGSSASMGVTLVGLLNHMQDGDMTRHEIAALANCLEIEELAVPGGKQDQYAAATGGVLFMQFVNGRVTVEPLSLSRNFLLDLEKHLTLVYTGKSRLSGNIIQQVMGPYAEGDRSIAEALGNIRQCTLDMKAAFCAEDIVRIGELMSANWENQKRLSPSMTTPKTEALLRVAEDCGMLGAKACGAGGGGCLLFLSDADREHVLREAVQDLGGQILPFNFDFGGLEVWEPRLPDQPPTPSHSPH
jgi:D-glycero-alpha-D-manno-heptose-7-phosphate kinase